MTSLPGARFFVLLSSCGIPLVPKMVLGVPPLVRTNGTCMAIFGIVQYGHTTTNTPDHNHKPKLEANLQKLPQ